MEGNPNIKIGDWVAHTSGDRGKVIDDSDPYWLEIENLEDPKTRKYFDRLRTRLDSLGDLRELINEV